MPKLSDTYGGKNHILKLERSSAALREFFSLPSSITVNKKERELEIENERQIKRERE